MPPRSGGASDDAMQISVIVRALDEFAAKKVVQITLEATAILTEDTPRDTSWARSNYVPRIGAEFEGTAGTRQEAEAGRVSFAEQQRGLADVVSRYRLRMGNVYITNNVPYLPRLNDGSSRQQPAGFIQRGLIKAVRVVEGL